MGWLERWDERNARTLARHNREWGGAAGERKMARFGETMLIVYGGSWIWRFVAGLVSGWVSALVAVVGIGASIYTAIRWSRRRDEKLGGAAPDD